MKKLRKMLAILAAAIVAAFGVFSMPVTMAFAESESASSSVMDDLKTDSAFSVDNYPAMTVDEMKAAKQAELEVIKIAESADDCLYIYVYQPTDATTEIVATYLLIGQTESENAARVLPLSLVSTDGVFDKYRVEGLQVMSSISQRYYQITSIYRSFDAALDDKKDNGGEDEYIAVGVGQSWLVQTGQDGMLNYNHTKDDVITITDEYHGTLFSWDTTDKITISHFLAFSTDRRIDELKQVELVYMGRKRVYVKKFLGEEWLDVGEYSPKYLTIKAGEKDSNTAGSWIDRYYEWDKISSVDSFINNDNYNLSSEAVEKLERVKQTADQNETQAFVLRFFKDSIDVKVGSKYGGLGYAETEDVTKVALLKLTYKTKGIPYTMGVVDSMTTPDDDFDGSGKSEFEIWVESLNGPWIEFQRIIRIIGLVLGAVVVVFAVFGILKLIALLRDAFGKRGGRGGGDGNAGGAGGASPGGT